MKRVKVRKVLGYWTIWQYKPRPYGFVGPDYELRAWFDTWHGAMRSINAHIRYGVGY